MKLEKNPKDNLRISASDDIELGTYLEIAKSHNLMGNTPEIDSKIQTIVIFDFGSQFLNLKLPDFLLTLIFSAQIVDQ